MKQGGQILCFFVGMGSQRSRFNTYVQERPWLQASGDAEKKEIHGQSAKTKIISSVSGANSRRKSLQSFEQPLVEVDDL